METASLVVGGVGLSSLFTACVDCFEYVRLGRHFGKDWQTAILKLDLLELKLSRWADAVNTVDPDAFVQSAGDVEKVKQILGQIVYLFEELEKKEKKFGLSEESKDLDAEIESIHQKMKRLAHERQRRTSLRKKATWVLSERRYFNRLIEDVDPLIRDLVELFPAINEQQRQLSVQEVEELKSEKAIATLQQASEGIDENIRASLARVVASQTKHQFESNIATGSVRARYGDEVGVFLGTWGHGSVYRGNKVDGDVVVQYGDYYGGSSIFGMPRKL